MREFLTRLRFFFSRNRRSESDEELQFHLEHSIEANIAAGMTPEEARRQALIAFGCVERTREQTHQQHPRWLLGTVMQDIRYALRGFRRNPLFTITVIATLALGIGATTAVFSVVDPILFRPLPYKNADRLVSVGVYTTGQPLKTIERNAFMFGNFYFNWRDKQKPFAAFTSQEYLAHHCALTSGNSVQITCIAVEANFLPTLGVAPYLGRNFLPEEDRPKAPYVAIISYKLWNRHFNRDPGILNKFIEIEGEWLRVVGVLPKNFEMPTLDAADVLVPEELDETWERSSDRGTALRAFARLKPGVSIAQAKLELQPLMKSASGFASPALRKLVVLSVCSLREFQMQGMRRVAWILLGTALAVLLIACANIAGLFTARAAARSEERAVRHALGASRGRLVQQAFTEAFLLAIAGALVGCGLAEMLLRAFIAIAPDGILFLSKARLDHRIIMFAVFLSLLCAVLFGIAPALQKPLATSLAARAKNVGTGFRQSIVVAQIAITMILLSGAMLLLRSLWNLERQNLGIQTRHVLTVKITLPASYESSQKQMEFYQQAELALRGLPGITAVGISSSLPVGGIEAGGLSGQIAVAGEPPPIGKVGVRMVWRWVTPDYLRALNIPIIHGHNFTDEEQNSNGHFLILSKLLASRIFPKGNAVGQSVKPNPEDPWYLVVGVAGNVKNSGLTDRSEPEYYRLLRNFPADWAPRGIWNVMILQTVLPPSSVAPSVRFQIARIDSTAPVEIETLRQQVNKLAARPRFETALLGVFALAGLLMAIVGLYGVVAFVATQRTQEIGVRMALGASRFNILRLILWQGGKLIALGGIVGLVCALALSRVLKSLLFSISPYDPISFIAVALLLIIVALVAILIPARSAMKADPVIALRHE